jgi:hypothetical protein
MTNPGVPPPQTTLSGVVSFKGAPLAGATVVAFATNTNSTFATAVTDANGAYSFSGMGTSCTTGCKINFQFWAAKPGYAFYPVLAANPGGSRAAYLWDAAPQNWYVTSGANVTRAGYNGQFTNPGGGAGNIFTVINFMSTPNNSVTGANFVAYDGSSPLATLPASGQSSSYAAGDDAAWHKGVAWPARRFTDNQDGSVSDSLTGLVWLKDAGCLAPAVWAGAINAVNQLANGACGLSDGSSAGQWRLPNLRELESLVDESASSPATPRGSPFTRVSNGIYWTSTSYYGGLAGSPQAWALRMGDGSYVNDSVNNLKTAAVNAVWAVKGTGGGAGAAVKLHATGAYVTYAAGDDGAVEAGVPLTFPRMRDNGNGTVTDTVTGLVWLKKADCIQQPWAGALAAVNQLASGQCGLSDGSAPGSWRMPNRKELESLADRAQNNLADYLDTTFTSANPTINSLPAIFTTVVGFQYYWTSTTNAGFTNQAWTLFSCDYGVYSQPKANVGYTLAVR